MGKLDLSKFKKVRSGEKHTVLRHPEGHEITIFHKALSKPIKAQLDKLEQHTDDKHQEHNKEDLKGNPKLQQAYSHMSEGGSSEHLNVPPKDRTPQFNQAAKRVDKNVKNQVQHFAQGGEAIKKENYDDGGLVTKKKVVDALRTSVGGQPLPSPSQAAPKYSPEEEAKRKATRQSYGYASGGEAMGEGPEGQQLDPLEAQYAMENFNAREAVDQSPIGQIEKASREVAAEAPITPPNQDMSHAHLSEAIKNLSSKFSSPSPSPEPAIDNMGIGEQPPIPQSAQAQNQGMPQGSLPQQAQANVNQANSAEMAQAKNTQQAMGQEAGIHGQEAQQMQDLRSKYDEIGNNLHHKFETLSADVEKGSIDPHQWWNSKSTGSKVLTAIGMLFSGAGMGLSGHPELASQAIDTAVNRDIDAQKANLQNKNNLLSKYMDMYQSLPQAEAAARLTMNAGIEGLLKQQAAKLGSSNAVNAALQSIAARRQALLPQMEGLAKGQIMMNYMNSSGQEHSGAPSSSGEQSYQQEMDKTRSMAMVNPAFAERAKDMEARYLPGVGASRIPVPDKLREEISSRKDLSDKLAQLELFAKNHSGEILDRSIVNQGKAMAAQVQDAYRTAHQQGVFKESEKNFLESILHGDPTALFANIRTLPGYRQARKFNDDTVKQYYKSYGIKPFEGSNESSTSDQQMATMNGKQYRKVPGGWEPVK